MVKKFKRMKLCRKDVEVDGRQVKVPYSSWLGHSRGTLQVGDFFIHKTANSLRLCRMHYRIASDPRSVSLGHIVAQRADVDMCFTGEFWVPPAEVIRTIPCDRMNRHIIAFFEGQIELNGY